MYSILCVPYLFVFFVIICPSTHTQSNTQARTHARTHTHTYNTRSYTLTHTYNTHCVCKGAGCKVQVAPTFRQLAQAQGTCCSHNTQSCTLKQLQHTLCVQGCVVQGAGGPHFSAVSTSTGDLLLFSPAGRRLLPPIQLGCSAVVMAGGCVPLNCVLAF